MNKRKRFKDLPILTPFRMRKDGAVFIKMPLYGDNSVLYNMYNLENKESYLLLTNAEVYPVDIIMEEI